MLKAAVINIKIFILLGLFLCLFPVARAQQSGEEPSYWRPQKLMVSPEYIYPSSFDRVIQTTSLNAFYRTNYFKRAKLNVDIGITATYAWGKAREQAVNGVPSEIFHPTSAYGAGPMLHFEERLFEFKFFSFAAEAAAGPIFYNHPFPKGGDFYNFMLRAGVLFEFRLNKTFALAWSCKWMHVSNGQGSGPHNPFYEGYGMSLGLTRYFGGK